MSTDFGHRECSQGSCQFQDVVAVMSSTTLSGRFRIHEFNVLADAHFSSLLIR